MGPYRALPAELFMVELALTSDALLIDLRTDREIKKEQPMEGAIHLDYLSNEFDEALKDMDKMRPYFLYDDGGKRAALAASKMARQGFMQIAYLQGGLPSIEPDWPQKLK
jgi:rhodanese-related sulfurtransferase